LNFTVYTYHIFLIHSSVVGHLGCFHSLALVSSAAVNTGVQVSLLHFELNSFVYIMLAAALVVHTAVLFLKTDVFAV
jgi:hypothetical protein